MNINDTDMATDYDDDEYDYANDEKNYFWDELSYNAYDDENEFFDNDCYD